MNVKERILTVFRGEIPDRIPTFVQQLLPEFREKAKKVVKLNPKLEVKAGNFDFSYHIYFGFESGFSGGDSALLANYDDFIVRDLGDGKFLDFYGRIMRIQEYENIKNIWYLEGTIKNENDWNNWKHLYPRNLSPSYFQDLKQLFEKGESRGFLPIPICQGLFAKCTEIMTFERFSYYIMKKPEFVEKILDKLLECKINVIDQYSKNNISLVGVADDVALKNSTFISPKLYEKYFVPRLKILTDHIHSKKMFTFLHSDGDISPFIPLIINAGFDGVECLEVAAGVDIFNIKKKYGSKITLIGNLDASHLLTTGSVDEVKSQTKKLVSELKTGGRYIFAPCADIFKEVKIENLQAILPVLKDNWNY
jgi:hypothetical protein